MYKTMRLIANRKTRQAFLIPMKFAKGNDVLNRTNCNESCFVAKWTSLISKEKFMKKCDEF